MCPCCTHQFTLRAAPRSLSVRSPFACALLTHVQIQRARQCVALRICAHCAPRIWICSALVRLHTLRLCMRVYCICSVCFSAAGPTHLTILMACAAQAPCEARPGWRGWGREGLQPHVRCVDFSERLHACRRLLSAVSVAILLCCFLITLSLLQAGCIVELQSVRAFF